MRFPTRVDAITPVFLADVLQRPVVDVLVLPLGEPGTRHVAALEVTCADGGSIRLVAKVRRPGRTHPALVRQELHFYRHVADRLRGCVPRPWYVESDDNGDFLLLVDHSPGRHPATGLDLDGVEAVLRILADVHGSCWGDDGLREGLPTRIYEPCETERLVSGVRDGWDRVRARFPRHLLKLPDLDDVPEAAARLAPSTVTHNDLHAGNLLVGPTGVVLVDWQNATWSTPMLDVANVLAGCVRPEVQQRHWRTLLTGYEEALVRAGGRRIPDMICAYRAMVALQFAWVVRYLADVSEEEARRRPMLLAHWERVCTGLTLTR